MKLFDVFNEKETENGDRAYKSTRNKYLDVLFASNYYRHNPDKIPDFLDENSEFDKWYARFMRDPRQNGNGARTLGQNLMLQANIEPYDVLVSGRADDIFNMGYKLYRYNKYSKGGKYWEFIYGMLTRTNEVQGAGTPLEKMMLYNIKKWLPRIAGKRSYLKRMKARAFRDCFNLTSKQYNSLLKGIDTTESILSRKDKITDYEKVPSLAILRHQTEFKKDENYLKYMDEVSKGNAKINTGAMNVYDICKNYHTNNITPMEADVLFGNLPKANLGKMIAIVDNSASMKKNKCQLKARAIGHYIAKNTMYMNNHIITFSSRPALLELGKSYEADMNVLNSFKDVSNTDFGRVMELLEKVTQDVPDWIVVLSDMEFDIGSSCSKDKAMKTLRKLNPNLKLVWWNLSERGITSPETDKYQNIFMGGFNPKLLALLKLGFNGEAFVKELVENYKQNIIKELYK